AAEEGIAELQKHVDTLIIIPNQNLFLIANANTTMLQAFAMADQVLHQGVRGITDLMIMPGLINLDFADIRTVMSEMGKAMMGTGEATGEGRAIEAAEKAISNPLLDEVSLRGAKGVIINITGGDDLKLMEVDEAASHIRDMVDADANIIVGSAFNKDLAGVMRVSVVATGIDAASKPQPVVAKPAKQQPAFMAQPSIFSTPPAPAAYDDGPIIPASAAARVFDAVQKANPPAPPQPPVEPVAAVEPPAPVAEEPDEDVIDLADAERVAPAAGFRFTPSASEPPAPPPEPAPLPEPDMQATPLFARMMGLGRSVKPKPQPPATLAPEPQAEPRSDDDDLPPFMRRQLNR
ncbi:MAG: cell division protein FtsZ, partial [Sphingomonadales bacterium]